MKIMKGEMKREFRAGFTLLELLTVMAIGIILMSISTAAYFGMVRSSALGGSVSGVRTVLSLARQHAISNRRRTYVIFDDDKDPDGAGQGRLCVTEHVGIHVGDPNPNQFRAEVRIGESGDYIASRIFNIDQETRSEVSDSGDRYLVTPDATWTPGDRCAMLIHDWVDLPEGLVFTNMPDDKILMFMQDGTTPVWGGDDFEVTIQEKNGDGEGILNVESLSGIISVTQGVVN